MVAHRDRWLHAGSAADSAACILERRRHAGSYLPLIAEYVFRAHEPVVAGPYNINRLRTCISRPCAALSKTSRFTSLNCDNSTNRILQYLFNLAMMTVNRRREMARGQTSWPPLQPVRRQRSLMRARQAGPLQTERRQRSLTRGQTSWPPTNRRGTEVPPTKSLGLHGAKAPST
jgi:hypothetical protein